MFTSRAEHRLLLRIDNADLRLTEIGRMTRIVGDSQWEKFSKRRERFHRNLGYLKTVRCRDLRGETVDAARLLKQPDATLARLATAGLLPELDVDDSAGAIDVISVETAIKYEGYIARQEKEIERDRRNDARAIPSNFPFEHVPGLTREAIERLKQVRPDSLGHARRVPGVTPAAVAVVGAYLHRLSPKEPRV